MKPSKYQEAVYAFVRGEDGYQAPVVWDQPMWGIDFQGKKHAVVEAVAGSGKTTTIIKTLDFLDPVNQLLSVGKTNTLRVADTFLDRCEGPAKYRLGDVGQPKVLFVAFNTHIADELKRRVPRHVTAATLNAVGWGICRASVRTELDKFKDENILRTLMDLDDPEQRKVFQAVKNPTSKLIGLFKAFLYSDVTEVLINFDRIADRYDVAIPDNLGEFDFKTKVAEVWQISVDHTAHMSFDDQKFMPLHHGWTVPTYEWVFGDECQDWSKLDRELVKQLGRDGRIVAVGDRFQSVYGFRGADPDSIPKLIEELDAVTLPLSICYRCPSKVIKRAQTLVPHIEEPDPNPRGEGVDDWLSTPEFISQVGDGDYVLCRTTAPLVKRCLEMIGRRRKATVKGRDIGQGLLTALEELAPRLMPVDRFIDTLRAYRLERVGRLAKAGRENEAQVVEDRCDTLEVLAFDCANTLEIKKRIDQVFSDKDSPGITFMTMHRCKGLEASRVFLLRTDLCPHPRSKSEEQLAQEYHLLYVAITRSTDELYWVTKEKDEK